VNAWAETAIRRFLEAGFLPPPARDQPAILPHILSAGEEAKPAFGENRYFIMIHPRYAQFFLKFLG
jgi:hypothetical protein